jgi:hypothetical protein
MPQKLPISLQDYERIYQVIWSLLNAVGARPEAACVFFSIVGAAILQVSHKLAARPVAGAAVYAFDANGEHLVTYGAVVDGYFAAESDAFHAWVECEGYAIDFMAPVFTDAKKSQGQPGAYPRKMFQRRIDSAVQDGLPAASAFGSFAVFPDEARTQEIKDAFSALEMNSDLGALAMAWYQPSPHPIRQVFEFRDNETGVLKARLKAPALVGSW